MMNNLENTIKTKLAGLKPNYIELIDDSHKHVGHAGVRESGGKHYTLIISSECFDNLSRIKQHQLIYNTLGSLMGNEIHALRIIIK